METLLKIAGAPDLRPFILATEPQLSRLVERCPLPGVVGYDVLTAESRALFAQLVRGNARAFGGIGMPAWVQLDCCTLPSAMIGFQAQARSLPEALRDALEPGAADDDWLPVAEYCALPQLMARPGAFIGISLYTLLPGFALGLRAKALALYTLGARTLTGIAQYHNASLRAHTAFGPCRVRCSHTPNHSVEDTFVYTLEVPDEAALEALVRGGYEAALREPQATHALRIEDGPCAPRVAALMEAYGGVVDIAWPGLRRLEDGARELVVRAGL